MTDPRQSVEGAPAGAGGRGRSPGSLHMVSTMGAIGFLAAILLVFTFQTTLPVIERNRARALEKAIVEVVPGTHRNVTFQETQGVLRPRGGASAETGMEFYACYDSTGRLLGVAVEASGQGFQDILRILYGYSPQRKAVIGMKVLESKETPGLGTKIETDPAFRANFEALEVGLEDDGEHISNPVELVKHGKKTAAWQVEAITGATISSRAIASILRESTAVMVPIIERNLESLQPGEAAVEGIEETGRPDNAGGEDKERPAGAAGESGDRDSPDDEKEGE